jgi:predicted RNase H-like nuclease (RuvC/YqgF family)
METPRGNEMNGQEKSYTKLDGLLRNIDSKIEVDSTSKVVQISRYARDWEDVAEEIKKLKSDNSVLRTNVDGLEAKNVDLQAKVDGLEVKINRQQREIDRLRSRDGHATIELCYNDGNNPFAREKLKVCDFGVSDNCYVVESEVVEKLQADNTQLLEKVKELEAEVAGLKSMMMEFGSDCDCLSYGGQKLHDKLCVVGKIEQAIETPTGSKLLAKIEIADQIAEILLDHPDFKFSQVEIDELDDVLSRYRTACNPTKESEASR